MASYRRCILVFLLVLCWATTGDCENSTSTLCTEGNCAICNAGTKVATCNECPQPKPYLISSIQDDWFKNCSCTDNCDVCAGPGKFECLNCSQGYCIEDKAYRLRFYAGAGQCWDRCSKKQNSITTSSSSLVGYHYFFLTSFGLFLLP